MTTVQPRATQPARSVEPAPRRGRRAPAVVAWAGAATFVAFGAWAMLDPRSFFDRAATFEPYNRHFLQDIGAFQLGLGAVLLLGALRPRADALAVALLGAGVGALAHAVSHVAGHDLGGKPVTDIPMFLVLAVLLLGAGALRARESRDR